MSVAATRNLVAWTTGQQYLTLKTLISKKKREIIIIINACQILRSGRKLQTTGVRPSYYLSPRPLPPHTHQRLIYPIRKCFFPWAKTSPYHQKTEKKISVSSGPGNLKHPPAQPQIHGHQCMRAKGAPTHLHVLHPPPKKFQIVTKFTL